MNEMRTLNHPMTFCEDFKLRGQLLWKIRVSDNLSVDSEFDGKSDRS